MFLPKMGSLAGCAALLALGLAAAGPAVAVTISEFPVPTAGSQPNGAVPGPDGNLWFVELNGNNIARVTPAGVITEFPVPTAASQPSGITAGPDGNLWFSEAAGNKIGRITMSGQITEFPIPTGASSPETIVTGPDGNLWFAERDGNQIGRITPSGQITEFPVPTASSQPIRIISGADGNLWFVENQGNKVGRITPAGVITEFPIPTAGAQPQQIIDGPDGNFWFVETGANRIGRITPAGVITEFVLPGANSQPNRIVAGRDNNLWFTESNRNRIGRITPAGAITEFVLPNAASGPNRINRGRDTNLWFTENAGNRLGRITYDGVITEFPVTTTPTNFIQILNSFDGNLWYLGGNGNVVGRVTDPAFNAASLAAAVLPGSRSVQVGGVATAFATIINSGNATAKSCQINDLLVRDPEVFSYQTTDPSTNALTGTPNTPVDIPANSFQTFVFSMTATGPFVPQDLRLGFSCTDVGSVGFIVGVNTFLLSASSGPVPDVVALGATSTGDGILHLPGSAGANAFAVATANVGASGAITFTADTAGANLPLAISVCQTDPANGTCLSPAGSSASANVATGATPTFAVFVQAIGSVPFDPANSRIFGRFTDASNAIRGETSVAVTTVALP